MTFSSITSRIQEAGIMTVTNPAFHSITSSTLSRTVVCFCFNLLCLSQKIAKPIQFAWVLEKQTSKTMKFKSLRYFARMRAMQWNRNQFTLKKQDFIFFELSTWAYGRKVKKKQNNKKKKKKNNAGGHEPQPSWVMQSDDSSWARKEYREREGKGERNRGILSSQEIEAITSKLSSGPFGGQEQTNQFGLVLSACQPHRRTPWHLIIGAQ